MTADNPVKDLFAQLPEMAAALQTVDDDSTRIFVEFVSDTICRAYDHSETTFVAWTDVTVPEYLLYAMDNVIPAKLAMIFGFSTAVGLASEMLDEGDGLGVPRDSCSFNRAIVGGASIGAFPKADMAFAAAYCSIEAKSFDMACRLASVPLFTLGMAYHRDAAGKKYYIEELKQMVRFLEERTGKGMDPKRLRDVMLIGRETQELYNEIYELRSKTVPCPTKMNKSFEMYAMTMWSQGTEKGLEYARALRDNLKQRAKDGYSPCSPEKHRVLWMHTYPFYDPGLMDWLETELNVNSPVDTNNIIFNPATNLIDPENPLESVAEVWLGRPNVTTGPDSELISYWIKIAKEARIDAVIHFAQFGCRIYTAGVNMYKDAFKKAGLPYLGLPAEPGDPANYSASELKYKLESFIQSL